jgi:hypothetical protein
VPAYLLDRIPWRLLDQLDEVWGAKLPQGRKSLCARINGLVQNFFTQSDGKLSAEGLRMRRLRMRGRCAYSGTAGATIVARTSLL